MPSPSLNATWPTTACTTAIELIQSDAFQNLAGRKFDLIVSNPPYVNAESVARLPPEYLHEPELALGSGDDGLDFTRIILHEAKQHLTDNGILVVEIGHNREALEAAYPTLPFTWLDTAGRRPVRLPAARQPTCPASHR